MRPIRIDVSPSSCLALCPLCAWRHLTFSQNDAWQALEEHVKLHAPSSARTVAARRIRMNRTRPER